MSHNPAGSRKSEEVYVAADIGAGSGRIHRGVIDGRDRLRTEEVHRFPNSVVDLLGRLHWDVLGLYRHLVTGLRLAGERGGPLASLGVDTWGVDFGLFDGRGELLAPPRAYRDRRFPEAMADFLSRFGADELYRRTGVQQIPINTVFQLHAMAQDEPDKLSLARRLLLLPDLLHYFLTGTARTEFTNATTSGLINPRERTWDREVLAALGVDAEIFQPLVEPGTVLGPLNQAARRAAGVSGVPVVAPATHDTASAVAAVSAGGEGCIFISAGTWSLLGFESPEPVDNDQARTLNFTNEGGVFGTWRVLKNISGMWILEECRREWGWPDREALFREAEGEAPFPFLLDPNHPGFLSPPSMIAAVESYCRRTGQAVPASRAALVRGALESLVLAYRHTLAQAEDLAGWVAERIHLIGGASRVPVLGRFTADATGRPVTAGPTEATVMGNLLLQAHAAGRVESLAHLRDVVRRSADLTVFSPGDSTPWDRAYDRFLPLVDRP